MSMRVSVLGCHGGESPKHRSTCFLIDGTLAIDAGALTSGLNLAAQRRVRHILISHCHLDHIKDLAMLADNVVGQIAHTIDVVATSRTLAILKRHILNDVIWPDFTRIPSLKQPVYRLVPLRAHGETRVGPYRVRGIPVQHPVESTGLILRHEAAFAALGFSSDTGPTTTLWRELAKTPTLRALLVEVSFPNRLQRLADHVGHLTPHTLAGEIGKFDGQIPIYLYHLKPAYEAAVRREIKRIGDSRLRVLRLGQTFRL